MKGEKYAMPKILAVTEEMINMAATIGSGADDIFGSQNRITGIFQNMGRDFSGTLPSLMTEKMIAMEDIYQGMNETLNGYKTFLEDTARNYEWTDEEAARWTQALAR